MTVQELKKLIKENNIPNFLIFTGEEWKVQHEYIKQIAKVKNLVPCFADDIDEVWRTVNATTLFGNDMLYVLYNDKEFMTNEKIYSQIESKLANNTLILVLTSVDKRLKIIKQYKDSIVEFNALNDTVLKQYIQRQIPLSDRNCNILIEVCEHNYGHCLLEIDKLKMYANAWKQFDDQMMDYNQLFEWLLDDGNIYIPPKDRLWDFIKAFLQNKPFEAYEYYQNLKELDTPTFSILSNLYNNTKQVLQVQICQSDNIEKTTGLTAWQIRNAKECVNKFKAGELSYLMRLIQRVETDIKQGKLDEELAIDYIFTNFF